MIDFDGVIIMTQENYLASKVADTFNLFSADNQALFDLSLKFANGDGVDTDFVAAHICLNIAAMRGCEESAEYRRELAFDMSTIEVAKAQKEARALLKMLQTKFLN